MDTVRMRPIVVGVDGSEPSLAACRWAAREAQATGHPLQVVYGYVGPALAVPLMAPPYDWLPEALQKEGEELVAEGVAAARAEAPDLVVETKVLPGVASQLLAELSEGAYLVVVGHRGHGGFGSLLLGSVASTVIAHAKSPAVVVRGAAAAQGPVVVGVDGSEPSLAALRFGFAAAARRGVPVHAVHTYQPPSEPWLADARYDPEEIEAAERHRLDGWLGPVREEFPDVPVHPVVMAGHPAGRLVDLAAGAGLLVVGSRGRGGFTGLLLGSVSQQVIRHAECPVAVVR